MPTPKYAPLGTFCWPELATTDLVAAKAFYGRLLGWTFEDVPTAMGNYTLFQLEGVDVAAGYQMGPQQTTAPRWNNYLQVASADASHAKALELGATSLAAPYDIPNVGRMAFIQDPGGAPLLFWQSGTNRGAGIFDRPGALCWTELATPDGQGAAQFYGALLGWRAETRTDVGMVYTEFFLGDAPVAGMYERPGHAARWIPYFAVQDVDAMVQVAVDTGGTIGAGPKDIPQVGRFALLHDAKGAAFAVIQLGVGTE